MPHWEALHRAWARLPAPLRVPSDVLAGVTAQLAERSGPALALGATAGLGDVAPVVTTIDASEARVRDIGPARRTIVGDWLRLPFVEGAFVSCVGDGCLNALLYPCQVASLLRSVAGVLRTGGRFVCRVFLAPDIAETSAEVTAAALAGRIRRFQALKFRLAMAITAEAGGPNVAVRAIHDVFEAGLPDRRRLAEVTGWNRDEIDTIDVYRSSTEVYSFPTRGQCLAAIPAAFENVHLVAAGTYELAERCPLLVMDRA
jgi:SAM-dependent methyltransferase